MRTRKPLSASERALARAAITAWNSRKWSVVARCGAKRKRDGEPCQQLALGNGRCAYHGGKTPKGDKWHRTQWPNGKAPDAEKRLRRKLLDQKRAEAKRAARIASMTPEQLKQYEKWQKAHRPGSAASRRREGLEQHRAREARELIDGLNREMPRQRGPDHELIELLKMKQAQLLELAANLSEGKT